jgi:hypothetical protein
MMILWDSRDFFKQQQAPCAGAIRPNALLADAPTNRQMRDRKEETRLFLLRIYAADRKKIDA